MKVNYTSAGVRCLGAGELALSTRELGVAACAKILGTVYQTCVFAWVRRDASIAGASICLPVLAKYSH